MSNFLYRTYGDIYFIQQQRTGNENEDIIKIGWSGDVKRRKAYLGNNSPFPLLILATIPGATRAQEAKLHKFYAPHRVKGEWFTPHEDILKMIREESWGDIIGELKGQLTENEERLVWAERNATKPLASEAMDKKKTYTLSELAAGCGVSRQRIHKVLQDKQLLSDCEHFGPASTNKVSLVLLVPSHIVEKLPWKFFRQTETIRSC